LRAIDGFSHILAEEHAPALGPEGRRLLDRVSASALQMAALVDALLEFSRLGRKALAREGVDMTALAREVAAAAREASPGTATEVGDLPPASGDRVLLRQVWQNLIGNAVKFSARAEKPAVAVGGRLEAGRASYYVRDNGEGFDMAYAGKLFRVFERLHSPRDYGGTGIGLATVKRIVERHGGEVRAESAPGRGATFWFSLPVSGKELDDCR
jgi:light-regulated signal transduction histidine kinase (bacteriophytochrome)